MMLAFMGRRAFAARRESGPITLITALDPDTPPISGPPVADRLDVLMHDIGQPMVRAGLVAPTVGVSGEIAACIQRSIDADRDLVAVCESGVGRSAAIVAAAARMLGQTEAELYGPVFSGGAYNRRLYQQIVEAAGLTVAPTPKVSIVVRVKYPLDRLEAFLLSLQRQRWPNWECVVVTDGPHPDATLLVDDDRRVRVVETPERRGRWGHPWRQAGIDACTGDYIGLQNDDNYLTPGFMEQAVLALQYQQEVPGDLCLVNMVHNYFGYAGLSVQVGAADLGAWLASAELVKATPWVGDDFYYDNTYLIELAKRATNIVQVRRFLMVHN
jgi:hypothetical protein